MNIKLLYTIFIAIAILSFSSLQAQSAGKKREVGVQLNGINFGGFNSFSGFYKKQLNENKYRRVRFFSGNLFTGVVGEDDFRFNLNLGAAIGREKRRALDTRLDFFCGPEFAFSVGFQSINDDTAFSLFPSFGYVLGLQHSFNERWAINIETIPSIGVGVVLLPGDNDQLTLDAGITNSVALGVVRKF